MATQSYATHRYNPKPTGIGFLFVVLALVAFAAGLLSLSASIVVLLSISRTYTTKLQDRIIKLEMRLRCAQLLSGAQQATLNRLSNTQIVALRFASDEELPSLLERAEREQLTANQIKQAIKSWLPDLDRT